MTNIYLITGGRTFGDISDKAMTGSVEYQKRFLEYKWVKEQIHNFFLANSNDGGNDIKFVFGDARGVDDIAWNYCKDNFVAYQRYKADWDTYKRAAGHIRNGVMLKENINSLKGILAFPGGIGTANMVGQVETYNRKVGEANAIPIHKFTY